MDMYGFWRSQAAFRLRVALNIKGVAYKEIPVDIDGGAQNEPAFRKISPMGSVPALMVDGTPLIQSSAVLEYIEEAYPQPPLLPADPIGRAYVRSLAAMMVSDSHPLIVPRVKRYLTEHAAFDAAQWKTWQTHWLSAGLHGVEARLGGEGRAGLYCNGDVLSLADICVVGVVMTTRAFSMEISGIPTVMRIAERCFGMKAFDDALPNKQADYPR